MGGVQLGHTSSACRVMTQSVAMQDCWGWLSIEEWCLGWLLCLWSLFRPSLTELELRSVSLESQGAGTEISPSLVSCCGERRSFSAQKAGRQRPQVARGSALCRSEVPAAPGASFVTLVAPSRLKAESLISHTSDSWLTRLGRITASAEEAAAQSQSCDHGICTSARASQ